MSKKNFELRLNDIKFLELIFRVPGNTPLHMAAKLDDGQLILALLKSANISHLDKNQNQMTPLDIAAYWNNDKATKIILENIEIPEGELWQPWFVAAQRSNLRVCQAIFDQMKGDKNPKDENGNTILHWAAQQRLLYVVQCLLNNIKGDKNPKNREGKSPLDLWFGYQK